MKFRKKPVVIEAIQHNGTNLIDILTWAGAGEISEDFLGEYIEISTLGGTMKADRGDWIIKGVKGEHYPCKPDIFEMTYEKVED